MNPTTKKSLTICLALVALAALCGPAAAQNQASSDLLLPYFEVDGANPGGLTTLFAVGNSTDDLVEVVATVYTNWGIPILEVPFTLQAREIRTVNLRDWFRQGGDPKKVLATAEIEHLAAAASGQRSPKDSLFYSTEVRPDLEVGYVTLRTQGNRPDALWGDWFNVDVAGNLARGDVLVNIDRSTGCPGLCQRHLLRYLSGGGFDGGTEVIIWRENQGKPSSNADGGIKMMATATAFNEPGLPIENRELALLPVQKVLVSELGLQEPFGALDVETEEETFFAVQHSAENRYSVGLTTYCLPLPPKPGPGIDIIKLTNGEDADTAPGPSIPTGGTITWEYLVTNTGNVELTGIVVEDDREGAVSCPHDSLLPGETMTCTATGTAEACQYENIGSASGLSPSGAEVNDSDISHYFGDDGAALSFSSILVNGQNAQTSPGPGFDVGTNLDWTFKITNDGKVRLTGIQLSGIAAACPKTALDPGESMDCTAAGGKAVNGPQSLPVSATGDTTCSEAAADAIGYYVASPTTECKDPAIDIEKATNGEDADLPQGPQIQAGSTVLWTYVVTNTGKTNLLDILVADDKGVAVDCSSKTTLAAGESMTCTGSGKATIGQYKNIGTVTAKDPCQNPVSDSDPSHYYGVADPGITIVKKTNGQDANTAPGPEIEVGAPVLWEYVVTNTGQITLTGVAVTDDKGVAVTCPKTTLKAGESMTCTGSGVAQACQYQNLGTATGTAYGGAKVSASDPSHYFGEIYPAIQIKKATNGQDADTAPGPEIPVGSPVNWTYVVTNTGNAALTGIQVTDDKGVAVSCPKTTLLAGESMTCTGNGTAQAGQYKNVGAVTGQPPCGNPVSDDDPSHYYGKDPDDPGLKIVKLTNGQDANTAPGPEIPVGSTVTWSYEVTNTGNVALSNLQVTDDKGVAVSCPKTTLQAGESMTCTGSGKAQACQYQNLGTVTGKTPGGQTLTDSDPSHYFGKTYPAIDVETKVNGQDADTPKGPEVAAGSALSFTYVVKNTGDTTLTGIVVTDSKGVAVSCPKTTLAAGESMTCTGSGVAQSGQYSAIGTASGNGACGQEVSGDDPVHYYGLTSNGDEGCTPGYWKNHAKSWPATGYSTSQKVQSVFSQASLYPALGSSTLLQALSFDGGSTLEGAAGNLLRAATAALLNSAHSGVDYPWVTANVISDVNAALASKNRDAMLALASDLDQDNNLGCPLN
jgi:hypothetical protein